MATSGDSFLLKRERERNSSTRTAFAAYADHRAQQMALLNGLGGDRIAILGAGNCNDLELPALARAFKEIHLFDIDGQAIKAAIGRQEIDVRRACHPHEEDLTGVAALLEAWRDESPEESAAQVAALERLSPLIAENGAFDVVLSTCMLSQVAINLRDFFGVVPVLNTALSAAIIGHVMLATALTRPGGTLLIVSDCITNQFPIREEAERHGPLKAIFNLAARGAAFPGTDPRLVAEVVASTDFGTPDFKGAWIWELTPKETYLVYALQGTRRPR